MLENVSQCTQITEYLISMAKLTTKMIYSLYFYLNYWILIKKVPYQSNAIIKQLQWFWLT